MVGNRDSLLAISGSLDPKGITYHEVIATRAGCPAGRLFLCPLLTRKQVDSLYRVQNLTLKTLVRHRMAVIISKFVLCRLLQLILGEIFILLYTYTYARYPQVRQRINQHISMVEHIFDFSPPHCGIFHSSAA